MKKILIFCSALFLFAGMSGVAAANTIFMDYSISPNEGLNCFGDSVSWSHAFDLQKSQILSSTLSVRPLDDGRDTWWRRLTTLGIRFGEDGTWNTGGTGAGFHASQVGTSCLKDAEYFMRITSLDGDYTVARSNLENHFETTPVPEPGTILLLGTGLIGLATFSRKLKN